MTRTTWTLERTDPYTFRLYQPYPLDGQVRDWTNANACDDVVVMEIVGTARLLERCLEAYAEHAAATQQPVPSREEIAAALQDWQPGPEDITLGFQLRSEDDLVCVGGRRL